MSYDKPLVVATDDMAEGVFMASGTVNVAEDTSVNHAHVSINNATSPATQFGQDAWYNTLSWTLDKAEDHASGGFNITCNYDRPVTYIDTGTPFVKVASGDGTNTLVIEVKLGTTFTRVQGCSITVRSDVQPTLSSVSAQCFGCSGA